MRTVTRLFWFGILGCLGGCCGLSRLFCGPDRSPWISQRFDSPRSTVQTLLEALRRDAPEALFLCLDRDYKRRLGIEDSTVLRLAWERFREANPYLHVAGYADVPEPTRTDAAHASVTLEIAGETIDLDLCSEVVWELRYRLDDAPVAQLGGTAVSFAARAQLQRRELDDRDVYVLQLAPIEFEHYGVDAVGIAAIEHAALTTRWRISDIRSRR